MKPSIVVFICHGSIGTQGRGQLELTPEDRSEKTDYVTGAQLQALLHGIPQAVIMNACETGNSSRSSVPLAWEMVSDKIPLAIGMNGRVADKACRLFSRKFFEALLRGEELHAATALARSEGIALAGEAERSVDWAMPALFMLDGVTVKVDGDAVKAMNTRAERAKFFRKITNPLVVCGRTDCAAAFSAIVDTPAGMRTPRTLAMRVTERYEGKYFARYGKTRVLEELAAIGALWGHVPCLVRKASGTLWDLSRSILVAAWEVHEAFNLGGNFDPELLRLETYLNTGAGRVDESVLTQIRLRGRKPPEEVDPKVILTALQLDLAALARDAAGQPGAARDLRVVVFIDDLHFSTAAEQLMTEWISAWGLGRNGVPEAQIVPLVFTYSSVDKEVYGQKAAAIRNVAEAQTTLIANVDLRSLPSPFDDELPYRQFLLSQRGMFVLPPDDDSKKRTRFFERLHKQVMGVPSRLDNRSENDDVQTEVEAAVDYGVLVEANDEQIVAQQGRPHG
jgi:hypothetical protein